MVLSEEHNKKTFQKAIDCQVTCLPSDQIG
jgi:hypothetical protein